MSALHRFDVADEKRTSDRVFCFPRWCGVQVSWIERTFGNVVLPTLVPEAPAVMVMPAPEEGVVPRHFLEKSREQALVSPTQFILECRRQQNDRSTPLSSADSVVAYCYIDGRFYELNAFWMQESEKYHTGWSFEAGPVVEGHVWPKGTRILRRLETPR